ncbi:alpha/beta hydrolase fold domain-containing protein [Natronomonas sp. CBA1123]|uniref:alpha/beta hydrolase n=1 Tax=Natronomonas sp. CBA1123 TaxID=2668070 RepID=UPI0012EAECBE|nr:alpha/beta hydrolase [Natronomonas sp. CBA1123]MUV86232.1 alpha/beta hydrolase fold domain-containing protein [Natronomonas sp. CBA1123]
MTDSAAELDPQVAELLAGFEAGVSPPTETLSVATGRALLNELFTVEEPDPVDAVTDLELRGPEEPVPVRIYEPKTDTSGARPVLVFFHGGGWSRGSLDAYDGLCRLFANDADCIVVSVDYRRAPEHPFPAGFEDCYAATEWAAEHAESLGGDPDRVAVGGDSAGGNLTAAVTLAARDRDGPDLTHQLLVYPAVNPPSVRWFDSYDENASGYFLEMSGVEAYLEQYLTREADVGNDYAFPLRARDLSGLPPATVVTAGFDVLRDEGTAYATRLETADVPVEHHHYPAQIHGFLSLYEHIDEGRQAIDDVTAALETAFEG